MCQPDTCARPSIYSSDSGFDIDVPDDAWARSQLPERRPGGLAAGVASDHAAALLPAALALDLVGGRAVLGHADAAAVAVEELPVGRPRDLGNDLHPPGDLGLRQPEHLLVAGQARRPDGGKRIHGRGSDGHHRALVVGLGTDVGDAGRTVVLTNTC